MHILSPLLPVYPVAQAHFPLEHTGLVCVHSDTSVHEAPTFFTSKIFKVNTLKVDTSIQSILNALYSL